MNTGKKILWMMAGLLAGVVGCGGAGAESEETFMVSRQKMIEVDIAGRGVVNPGVLDAMRNVPRHKFVPDEFMDRAYADHPLPIGMGQTISQPYIVAAMTELIDPRPEHVVFEVGTGSGYQAAVLAGLVRHVYTVEIVPELGEQAAGRLKALGYSNVTVRVGDGYAGWPEHSPFDSIIVTCGAEEVPPPLIEQLKPGGKMVIPVGSSHKVQELLVIEKDSAGGISRRSVMPVRFVPMTGEGQHKR